MSSFEIVRLSQPLQIATEVRPQGDVVVCLSDAQGTQIEQRYSDGPGAKTSYSELSEVRDGLLEAWKDLEGQLVLSRDSKPPKQPDWYFDGCEAPRRGEETSLAAPVGCYAIVVFVLFFVLPTLAAILLALGAVLGLVAIVVRAINEMSSNLALRRDENAQYLRVVTLTSDQAARLSSEAGLALLKPPFLSNAFHPKVVCYGRVGDRVVLAAAKPTPSKAAAAVAAEMLRQKADMEARARVTDAKVSAASSAAEQIAAAEARRAAGRDK